MLGPSALLMPPVPSAAMIAPTVRRSAVVVPIARISVPRSIPAASAGVPSNASAIWTRWVSVSVDTRNPKPALEPEDRNAFSCAIEVMKVKKRSRRWARAVAVNASI